MPSDRITVRGAREHNLKNVDLEIPRDRFVVFTGLSGSGKSSLAFDTIFAEGQRRYVESLSAYARQFLGQMEKPDVDHIDGLSPAISIDQKGSSRNPRSTVGTVTEVYDHLRLLYARIGHPHCPVCGREISKQSVQQMTDQALQLPDGARVLILGPVIRDRKGEHASVFEEIRKGGFVRVRVDGTVRELDEEFKLAKTRKHTIEVVVDRLVIRHDLESEEAQSQRIRMADSMETALRLGSGYATIQVVDGAEHSFSEHYACPLGHGSIGEIEPRSFSFNSPHGACPTCTGLGIAMEFDPELIVPDRSLSLSEGAIHPWFRPGRDTGVWYEALLKAVTEEYDIPLDVPFRDLTAEQQSIILNGKGNLAVVVRYVNRQGKQQKYNARWEGVIPHLQRHLTRTSSDAIREDLSMYMGSRPCPDCKGARLKPAIRAITVADRSIVDISTMSVAESLAFVQSIPEALSEREMLIARQVLKEVRERLGFLMDVGLEYLTLDRSATTLSGGEAQRIRLATQIGSRLMGVMYVLDEPSIGLHPRDNARLIRTLESLRNIGNTLIVVEHDEETMRAADWIVDIGPGAGEHGGQIVAQGTFDDICDNPESLTGQYLSGRRQITPPAERRTGNGKFLTLKGARGNNLQNVDVSFPLGTFICVTGVSGSGKSTLIGDTLYRRLAQIINRAQERPDPHDALIGAEQIDKVIEIDQSPIGRTPRSNPATYTGAFTYIRDLFAAMPEAKARGYKSGRFSFNVKGGRCEACSGEGIVKIEMQFLPDVYVPCEVCHGRRYNREAQEILFKDRNIADVLDMTVEEGLEFFTNVPRIQNKLQTLFDVGLGYVHLGQPATQLSGGEAQRVKLATELSRRATGRTLYILDEPTTGLHFADIERLLGVLHRLADAGNTILVIEHNLDVIKSADWIIDLGPEGGNRGGEIVAEGTPEEIAQVARSYTGQALRPLFRELALAAD